MWDGRSLLRTQSSAWCSAGMSATGAGSSGIRQSDPGSRRWRSLSRLSPEGVSSFSLWRDRSFRPAELLDWLDNAHEGLDEQLDFLRSRDVQTSYMTAAEMFDSRHEQAEARMAFGLENTWLHPSLFSDRLTQLEEDLLQMMSSAAGGGGRRQPRPGGAPSGNPGDEEIGSPGSYRCSRSSAVLLGPRPGVDPDSSTVLKVDDTLSDKECLIQKSDLQQQQQLENDQPDSRSSETGEFHHSATLMEDAMKALRKENEKLACELEVTKRSLEVCQSQLQEVTSGEAAMSRRVTDLEAERSQLIRERRELLDKVTGCGQEELTELRDKYKELRESWESAELEKQELQDRCLRLEAEVLEKNERLQLEEENHRRLDSARVQNIRELRAVASHWTEKWKEAALTLRSTQEELRALRMKNIDKDTVSGQEDPEIPLRLQLEACRQRPQLQRSRGQVSPQEQRDGEADRPAPCEPRPCEDLRARDQEIPTAPGTSPLPTHGRHNQNHQGSVERRSWKQSAGLMPLYEEDEDNDPTDREEEEMKGMTINTNGDV